MPYKIAQLIIHDPHHSQKTGEILIQPASESNEADLFILIEIDSSRPQDYQFIEQFLNTAYAAYENTQFTTGEKSLELILQRLNEELPNFLPRQRKWLERFHCLVALASREKLYFTTFGKIKVYLIKPALMKEIVGQTETQENKIFSYTLSGELGFEDKILFTTESLINYLSLEKIKKTIATLPPQSAVAHLSNILQATPPEVSFFSLILQPGTKKIDLNLESQTTKLTIPTTSKNSLDQLLLVEKETEKILTPPSFIQSIKERIKRKAISTFLKESTPKIMAKQRQPFSLAFFIQDLLKWLIKGGGWLRNLIIKIRPNLILKNFKNAPFSFFNKIIVKFKHLSKLNRALIIIILIILLIFSENLIWQGRKQSKLKDEEKYQQMLGEIENKQNGIEASLIYNDTVRAKQLLSEIYTILNTLPKNTKERIAAYQKVTEEIQMIYERVWKVTNILKPLTLINYSEINPVADVFKIVLKENSLFGLGRNNQLIISDLTNNQSKISENYQLQLEHFAFFPKIKKIIGNTTDKKFYAVNENEISQLSVNLPSSLKQIDDLTFYLDKMYLLDKAANQIFRLTLNGNNFTSPKNWLKDNAPVNQAVSMAVDGYLYLLLDNGQIQRYASGNQRDFPKISLEPALTAPKEIYTDADAQYLYVLDPPNKRFIVLSKEGEVKNQYYSEKFNDLKDFIVQEKEKKVYLLNSNQVLVVAIQ